MVGKIIHILIILSIILLTLSKLPVFAQECPHVCTDQNLSCASVNGGQSGCEKYILNKESELTNQANSLSAKIAVIDNNINLTEARIVATKQQISDLNLDIDTATKKVNNLQNSLNDLIKVLLNRMVATYEVGQIQPFGILLSSTNATNFFSRLNYLKVVQTHDKQLIYLTQQAKTDYSNQKNIFEDKKKRVEALKIQLQTYTDQLEQDRAQREKDLVDTKGQQAMYDQFLAQVRALSKFATSVGISLIPHQNLPAGDDWGKYYNQRDSQWGNNSIGRSSESIAAVGCLLTAYAMVVTHYGGSLTPANVAADSSSFSADTAYFNAPGPAANGHSATYVTNPSTQQLIDALRSGATVIAGLSSNGGPFPTHYSDHWVVLRSTDGTTFNINDPLYPDVNVPLNNHYSGWAIIEARIYQ